jgi:hypothetical protein
MTLAAVLAALVAATAITLAGTQGGRDVDDRLRVTARSHASVSVMWPKRRGATRYRVYRDGLLVGETARTTFTDVMLWPATGYRYRVDAWSRNKRVGAARSSGRVRTRALPKSGFPSPFGPASIWNRPLAENSPVHPNSDALIANWAGRYLRNPNMTLRAYGVPVAEVRRSDPRYLVPCTQYECTLSAFGPFRIPVTAKPDPGDDGHLAVHDPAARREWGMWEASYDAEAGRWSASAGAAVSLAGNGIARGGRASGNAANFPLLGGLIRPEEISYGRIKHPLVFGQPGIGPGRPVCPATANVATTRDPLALREGTLLQLDPAVDVAALGLPPWQRTVARALQEYGMYLRDNAGTLTVYAENPVSRGYDAWARVGLRGESTGFSSAFPWRRMRVIAAGNC